MKGGRTPPWLSTPRSPQHEVKAGIVPQETDDREQAELLQEHFDHHHQRQVRCSPCCPDVDLSLPPSCQHGQGGAGWFQGRPHTPQPRCVETASSPEPEAAQSAMLKRGCQKEDLLVLVGAAFQEQGVFGLSPLLREGCAGSERACQTEKGREKKLVTEEPKPVGSVRWLSAQVPAGFARRLRMRPLDHLFSSCLPKPRAPVK